LDTRALPRVARDHAHAATDLTVDVVVAGWSGGLDSAGRMMQKGMGSRLVALCFDANDPLRLARFWVDALHWEVEDGTDNEIGVVPTDDTGFRILFLRVPEPKAGT